jgi:hypothetical protein
VIGYVFLVIGDIFLVIDNGFNLLLFVPEMTETVL